MVLKISDISYEDCTNELAAGIAIYIRSFIESAKEVHFTCWSLGDRNRRVLLRDNTVQVNFLLPITKRYEFIPETIRTIYYIFLKLKQIENGKDAIVFHSSTYLWPYLFRRKSIPSVLIIHGTNSPITSLAVGRKKALFVACSDAYAIGKADLVILVSREGLDYYQKRYPKYRHKMIFYPTFVDSTVFYPQDLRQARKSLGLGDRTVLCCVGRLAKQKKVAVLLHIFKRIVRVHKDCFLCIVGDGPDRKKLVSMSKELEIDRALCFYGNVPNKDVRVFFNASVLSFTLSYWEGTAKTILESLACGTPAIVSDVADNRDIITNGKDGYVLDSDDDAKAAELAIRIIDNYDEFSKNALQKSKKYQANEIVPMIISDIKNLIRK